MGNESQKSGGQGSQSPSRNPASSNPGHADRERSAQGQGGPGGNATNKPGTSQGSDPARRAGSAAQESGRDSNRVTEDDIEDNVEDGENERLSGQSRKAGQSDQQRADAHRKSGL